MTSTSGPEKNDSFLTLNLKSIYPKMSIEPTNIFEPYYVQGIMLDIAEKKS